MKRALLLLGLLVCACGNPDAKTAAQQGSIKEVVVVLKGSSEPLPFDPRGGRITVVTNEIKKLVGHHVVFELDSALSPELKASFEETVLGSFETMARELVILQKEDQPMFDRAKLIERVVFAYDVVRQDSEGTLESNGKVLVVRTPPDRYPLLERSVLSTAIYDAHYTELEARWGDADPRKLPARERAPYFAYMMKSRPGSGHLWMAARKKKHPTSDETARVEHVGRITELASVVNPREDDALARKIRHFLLEQILFMGGFWAKPHTHFKAEPAVLERVLSQYQTWLAQNQSVFSDEERIRVARGLYEQHVGICQRGVECVPDAVFPSFDRFAFGLSIYDQWAKAGAKNDLPPGPRGELFKEVVCPSDRRGDAETEIKWGCSKFFALTIANDSSRERLAETIQTRKDTKLLEIALFNHPHKGGEQAVALVESLRGDERLFQHGFSVLFHDLSRVDDVKSALEDSATRWWKDNPNPNRRALALMIMARRWEGLHVHYGDNQWTRFVAEYGGPVRNDVFHAYLAQGVRAVEMTPKIWPALVKGSERDELVAKNLPVLLERDRTARTARAGAVLTLLRTRLCDEKNASGLAVMKSSIDRWATEHPAEAASVSNARADFTLARCKQTPKDRDD